MKIPAEGRWLALNVYTKVLRVKVDIGRSAAEGDLKKILVEMGRRPWWREILKHTFPFGTSLTVCSFP